MTSAPSHQAKPAANRRVRLNLLGGLQPLGRALMLPIAVLPVAGLLLRLGQPDLLNIAFISAAGQAVFANLGLLFAVAGLVLGVFMLILDFDYVEQGIRFGIDERESWRAAFGLTVTLVWLYVEFLRILAILRDN